jgi:hypothetical protein
VLSAQRWTGSPRARDVKNVKRAVRDEFRVWN